MQLGWCSFVLGISCIASAAVNSPKSAVAQFEHGLHTHNLAEIQEVVAPDIVVFENGQENIGWIDCRDHLSKGETNLPLNRHRSTSRTIQHGGIDHSTAILNWSIRAEEKK